jgi:hypothetical protein
MEDNKTNLELIEEYAGLFLTIDEISLLLDLDPIQFRREISAGKSDNARAYQKGKLQSMLEMRRQTVMFAKKGSPQAESFVQEYIANQKQNE